MSQLSSHQFSKLNNHLEKLNIGSQCIYSNVRENILAGKSLKIDTTFVREKEIKNKIL